MNEKTQRRLMQRIRGWLSDQRLTAEQLDVMHKFDNANAADGLSLATRDCQLQVLRDFALFLKNKPFQEASLDDARAFLASLSRLSKTTRTHYAVIVKKLLRFLGKADISKVIKVPRVRRELPNVLVEEEVRRIVEAADKDRDRALIHVMYESGCRLGELAELRLSDVQFDEYGAKLIVRGKTGDRPIRVIHSAPALQHWLEHHPRKEDPDAFVFCSLRNPSEPLSRDMFWFIVRDAAERAGINKRVHPHLFRHSRFTHLSRQLTDTELMVLAGWRTRSMCDVYNHLSMRDVEEKLLRIHGVKPEKRPEESPLAPKSCPRCQTSNPFDASFCSRCGLALDVKVAMRLEEARREGDQIFDKLLKDREVQDFLKKKMAELGILG